MTHIPASDQTQVSIPVDDFVLTADLTMPANSKALIVFAHGLRGSRLSPRSRGGGGGGGGWGGGGLWPRR